MGLKGWGERKAVGLGVRHLEGRFPMIRRSWSWLTDPTAKGRKRGIAAGAAILSAVIRGVGNGIEKACAAGNLVGSACTSDVGGYAEWIDLLALFADKLLVPGADLTATLLAAWALYDANQKRKAEKSIVVRAW